MTDVRTMTREEYRAAIARLGLSQNAASSFFGIAERTGRTWAAAGPPPAAAIALRIMLAHELTRADDEQLV